MKCGYEEKTLVSYVDGAQDRAGRAAVEAHLNACPACGRLVEQLRSDVELLRSEPEPAVPQYLAAGIMARVRTRSRAASSWVPVLSPAAALVLVVVGLWLGAALGRGMVGPLRSPADRLASVGMELTKDLMVEEDR